MLAPVQLWAQNGNPTPGKPEWISPLEMSTATGQARLEWAAKKGEDVTMYRFTEVSQGREGVFYIAAETLDLYRADPGEYRFRLAACDKDAQGLPACGPDSRQLLLTVSEDILANDPENTGGFEQLVPSAAEGPAALRPGLWHNPQKSGQGWSLYWANRLVESQNPPAPYDLHVIWYTYEARTRTTTPICEPPLPPCGNEIEYFNYRPVVATMNLVRDQGSSRYVGGIFIRRNGTLFNVGDAALSFSTDNAAAKISWTATFKKESLVSATDNIVLLAGSSGASTNDASHYAGLWGDTGASHFIADDLGSLSETIETVFYDDNGDPAWIQAYQGQTPVASNTSLCFYYVQGGYRPDLYQAALPGSLYTGCDPENPTSTLRNGRRYFSAFETGRFWVSFSLPPGVVGSNGVAGGGIAIGSSGTPATKSKAANFHRIWFDGSGSCQLNASSPDCPVDLSWFTDGDYPKATAYRYNQATGQRSLVATSKQAVMQHQAVVLSAAGQYVFELRMGDTPSSALIAESGVFTVSQSSNLQPTADFSFSCSQLSCSFTDRSSDADGFIASRSWSFGDGAGSAAQNPVHGYASAGTFDVTLQVTDDDGGTASSSQSVTVSSSGSGDWLEVFSDSFENGAWNGNWSEDAQNDWYTSSQRATAGSASAEVDGTATDAQLLSVPIDLQGRSAAVVSFDWLIESGLDTGEYLAFDVSTDGGSNWSEQARLRGNVDAEDSWQTVRVELNGLSRLQLRFRGRMSSSTEDANVDQVKVLVAAAQDPPNQGPLAAFSADCLGLVCSFTDQSSDSDGVIAARSWDFGDGGSSGAQNPQHEFPSAGAYTVSLTVTDDDGATGARAEEVAVTSPGGSGLLEVFHDSFEDGAWNGNWSEDAQDDWFVSSQRATAGNRSAEVDGSAADAALVSVPIDLQGRATAIVSFDWLIESGLDSGEYLAFDVSTDGGATWSEQARLRGNVDAEDTWHAAQVELEGLTSLRLRFRGRMSSYSEDANVDQVRVLAGAAADGGAANPETPPGPAPAPDMAADADSSRVGSTAGSFRVDEAGSATYRIDILTAPGSGGMAPRLSLDYDSQAGNGALGLGWALGGMSVITRCSQSLERDGAAARRGVSLTANDRFCLDGQRLVAVAGAYGAAGTEYRAEIDAISKIVSSGTVGTGPESFTVWRKDGTVTRYGGTADSRIEARTAADTDTVLFWAQSRVTDAAGNYFDYVYDEITGAPGEPVEFVLARVLYTGNSAAATAPWAQIDFIYGGDREDVTVAAIGGAQVRQSRLLERVDSRARVRSGSPLLSLRSYHLAYGSDGHGRKALASVTECNDASRSYCFPPSRFDWAFSKHRVDASSPVVGVGNAFADPGHFAGLAMADVNGDGRPDLLASDNAGGELRFRIATALAGGGFSAPGAESYALPHNGDPDVPVTVHAIDLNADGFQDVVYPDGSDWKARLSNGSSLGAELTVAAGCCGLRNPVQARVMDFDGDGLSDLVTNRASSGAGNELVLLRNAYVPGNPQSAGFDGPAALTIEVPADLFPAETADGWFIDLETVHFDNPNTIRAPFDRAFDYNGDGMVDLLVHLRQRYYQCSSGCNLNLARTGSEGGAPLREFIFDGGPEPAGPTLDAGVAYAWASFYVVLLADGGGGFALREVVATGTDCTVYQACQPYRHLPVIERANAVDLNADGLADFAYEDAAFRWRARLNLGGSFAPAEIGIAELPDGLTGRQAVFADTTGDGLPEFLYPGAPGDDNALWTLHENLHGRAFGGARTDGMKHGNAEAGDSSILADLNGDGMLDNLFVDLGGGQLQTAGTRLYLGRNVAAGEPDAPAPNLLTGITDGLGARILLSYRPLTDTAVYTRMRDAGNASWGNGFAVFDLVAPVHVVSRVQSSAPVFGHADTLSSVEYHYAGAKLQGGGRGFLGFGEIVSWDPQSGIRSNTRYRQDFPLIGRAADTTRVLTTSSHRFDTIGDASAASPPVWPAVSAATAVPATGSGATLLSYAVNQWSAVETGSGAGTWFPFIAATLEREFTLHGGLGRKTFTTRDHDGYGNLTQEIVRTYAAEDAAAFASQSSTHSYVPADTARWRLGRLSRSTVTHARSGLASVTRTSAYDYDSDSGILVREVIEPDQDAFRLSTDYRLDAFGNRITTTVSGAGFAPRSDARDYDPLGRFVVEARNAYGQLTRQVLDWDAYGNALSVKDIDGVTVTAAADFMGRPFLRHSAAGAWSRSVQRFGGGVYCPAGDTAFYLLATAGGQASQYHCFDVLGREIRSATQSFDGGLVQVDRYYEESGQPERVSEPYFSGQARYWSRTAYDVLGRIDAVLAADGNDLAYDYDESAVACGISGAARQVRITNGLGQWQLELRNALGETVSVFDHACGEISQEYDAIGKLSQVTGPDGSVSRSGYDAGGRKTVMDDPDKGRWQYAYNALGELLRQVDSQGQALDFAYDDMGRVTDRWERTGVSSLGDNSYVTVNHESTTWNNSSSGGATGKGQVATAVYREGENGAVVQQRDYFYDGFGRPTIVSTTTDGLQVAEETSYDEYGRVFQQFDASGDSRGIRYHYNARGYVEQLQEAREGAAGKVYQRVLGMDERGNVTYMVLGNGVEAFATYRPDSGRLDVLEAYDARGVELQFVRYDFDVLGKLLSRHDTSRSQDLAEAFDYDLLNRLEQVMLSVDGSAGRTTLSLQYDQAGNISYKSDVGAYLYGQGGAGPHAVTSAGGVAYTYDANGNQVSSSDGRSISYSVFDQALRVQQGGAHTEFHYGIANQRISRSDDNAVDGVRTTWYFGSTERIQADGQQAFFRRYLGGIAIADFHPATQQQDVLYLVKDHLGSIHTVIAESGLAADSAGMSFGPFGERRKEDWSAPLEPALQGLQNALTTRGFTGHEHADGLGIVHMNGRIYDPRLGRFLQADPFVQTPHGSQSLNRYSYALNNPLSRTDPGGFFSFGSLWKKIRPFVAIGIAWWNPGALLFSGAWGAAASGFLAGFVASGSLKGAVLGAFGAAAFYGIGSSFEPLSGSGNWGAAGLSGEAYAAKAVLHGAAGGVLALNSGWRFGHGFAAAGLTQLLSGWTGGLKTAYGRALASALVGGTASAVSGGKFSNGAMTGAFSWLFNERLHPFVQKTLNELQSRRFWTAFAALEPDEFRTIFPSLSQGRDDYEVELVQDALYTEFYSSGLAARVLDVAHDASDLLRDYSVGRVSGMLGVRGKLIGIIGQAAGLTATEIGLINDVLGLKAFAKQQGVHLTQLSDLARILNQGELSIGEALEQLHSLE